MATLFQFFLIYDDNGYSLASEMAEEMKKRGWNVFGKGPTLPRTTPELNAELAAEIGLCVAIFPGLHYSDAFIHSVCMAASLGLEIAAVTLPDGDIPKGIEFLARSRIEWPNPNFYAMLEKMFVWATRIHPFKKHRRDYSEIDTNFFAINWRGKPHHADAKTGRLHLPLGTFKGADFLWDLELDVVKNMWIKTNGDDCSQYLKTQILGLLRQNNGQTLKLLIVDPKHELGCFDELRCLAAPVEHEKEMIDSFLIKHVQEELLRRLHRFDRDDFKRDIKDYLNVEKHHMPYLVVVMANYESDSYVEETLNFVLENGHYAGIHFIISSSSSPRLAHFPLKLKLSSPYEHIVATYEGHPDFFIARPYLSDEDFAKVLSHYTKKTNSN